VQNAGVKSLANAQNGRFCAKQPGSSLDPDTPPSASASGFRLGCLGLPGYRPRLLTGRLAWNPPP